jgi:hypothetical protein
MLSEVGPPPPLRLDPRGSVKLFTDPILPGVATGLYERLASSGRRRRRETTMRKAIAVWILGSLAALLLSAGPVLLPSGALAKGNHYGRDTDGDGLKDRDDNCVEKANAEQTDSDADDVGNACDCDYNNDGWVDEGDFDLLKEVFLSVDGDGVFDPMFDHDGNDIINLDDFIVFRSYLYLPPGPSGITN